MSKFKRKDKQTQLQGKKVKIFDLAPTGVFGSSPPAKFAEALGFGRFRKPVPDPSNRWVGELYDVKHEVITVASTIDRLKTDGRIEEALKLTEENKHLLKFKKPHEYLANQLQFVNRQRRRVQLDPRLSADAKANMIKSYTAMRNKIAKKVKPILIQIHKGK